MKFLRVISIDKANRTYTLEDGTVNEFQLDVTTDELQDITVEKLNEWRENYATMLSKE